MASLSAPLAPSPAPARGRTILTHATRATARERLSPCAGPSVPFECSAVHSSRNPNHSHGTDSTRAARPMVRAVHLAPRTAGLMTLARAKRRLKLGGTATLPGKSAVDLRGGKAGRGSDNSADLLGVGRDDDGAVFGADGAAMDWGDGLEGMEGVDDWVTEEVGGKEKRVRLSSFRALVLDSSYRPIEVVNWQRAICLHFGEKADVLESYSIAVNSARNSFSLPAVLRVRMYVQRPPKHRNLPVPTRKNVLQRDGHTCQYCGNTKRSMSIDHVNPLSRGGRSTWENLVTACTTCNQKKGAKTLAQMGWQPMRAPRAPKPGELVSSTELPLNISMHPKEWALYIEPFKRPVRTSALQPALERTA